MNDTVLALLSALAIYGLANFALPRSGWDTGEGDATTQAEETADLPRADDPQDDGPQVG